MEVIIQSPGFKAGENLLSFIREKLSKLEDHSAVIIRADVTLYVGSKRNPENNYCEIRLEIPGNDHFVKKSDTVFETAVTQAVDALQQMLMKEKERRIDRTRRTKQSEE
jgi:putative sigma-54 modulation protein